MVVLKGGGRCVYTLDLRGICKGDAAWVWGMTTLMVHADAAAAAAAAAADCITHRKKTTKNKTVQTDFQFISETATPKILPLHARNATQQFS